MRARPTKRRKTATSTGSPTEDALIPVTPTSINAEKQPCAHSEDTPTSVERMTAKLLWGAEELRRAGDRTRAYMCLKTCLSFVQPTAVEIDVRLRLAELLAPAKAAALLDEAKACATKAYQMACELADIDDRLKYRCVHWMAQLVAGAAVDKAVQKERARALRLQRHELFIKLGICSARLRARNPASLARAFEDLAASIGHADAHGCIEGKANRHASQFYLLTSKAVKELQTTPVGPLGRLVLSAFSIDAALPAEARRSLLDFDLPSISEIGSVVDSIRRYSDAEGGLGEMEDALTALSPLSSPLCVDLVQMVRDFLAVQCGKSVESRSDLFPEFARLLSACSAQAAGHEKTLLALGSPKLDYQAIDTLNRTLCLPAQLLLDEQRERIHALDDPALSTAAHIASAIASYRASRPVHHTKASLLQALKLMNTPHAPTDLRLKALCLTLLAQLYRDVDWELAKRLLEPAYALATGTLDNAWIAGRVCRIAVDVHGRSGAPTEALWLQRLQLHSR